MTEQSKQEAINERIRSIEKSSNELAELANKKSNLSDILIKGMQIAMLRADIDIIISQPTRLI